MSRYESPRQRIPPRITAPAPRRVMETASPEPRLPWTLITVYLSTVLLGACVLQFGPSRAIGNEMNFPSAVFASVNAATLTGFHQTTDVNEYTALGQCTIVLLTIAGAFLTMLISSLAVVRILALPYAFKSLLRAATICLVGVMLIGGVALYDTTGETAFDGIIRGASAGLSAFANSGTFLGTLHKITDWQTLGMLMPLALLGGVGLPVLMQLYDLLLHKKPISAHSATVLNMTIGLYLACFVLFLIMQLNATPWTISSGDWLKDNWSKLQDVIASSSVAAVNSRTAGLPFQYASAFPRAMQWLLMLVMMIGASPAGTGGGLKTTTVFELFRGTSRLVNSEQPGRGFGIALTWLGTYLLLLLVGLLMLLGCESKIPGDQLLFMAISALSNVGLSHGQLAVSAGGNCILALIMLAGRFMPFLILLWMAQSTKEADLAIG